MCQCRWVALPAAQRQQVGAFAGHDGLDRQGDPANRPHQPQVGLLVEVTDNVFDMGPALLRAARADPDGFRLLFRHVAREPDFRDLADSITAISREVTHRNLTRHLPAGPWLDWAAGLIPTLTLEAVLAWLDGGQAAERIGQAAHGVMAAARPLTETRRSAPGGCAP